MPAMTRRRMMQLATTSVGGLLLAACGQAAPTPAPPKPVDTGAPKPAAEAPKPAAEPTKPAAEAPKPAAEPLKERGRGAPSRPPRRSQAGRRRGGQADDRAGGEAGPGALHRHDRGLDPQLRARRGPAGAVERVQAGPARGPGDLGAAGDDDGELHDLARHPAGRRHDPAGRRLGQLLPELLQVLQLRPGAEEHEPAHRSAVGPGPRLGLQPQPQRQGRAGHARRPGPSTRCTTTTRSCSRRRTPSRR